MSVPELIVETLPVGHMKCNCTILGDPVSRKAIVVDPGGEAEMLIERLLELDLQVERIIHTHAHLDHFLASGKMKEATGAKLALHRDDLFLWNMLEDQCRMFGIPFEKPPPPDQWLEHEEEIEVKGVQLKALHTPGHTPGSMCFLFEKQKLLIAGDTLFQGSIGRTDLWGGDYQKIEKSIQEKLYTLDEDTAVITGHGESTSIGHEMRSNSFVRA
jgi:hydroxyacylglutathione hydrolase